MKLISRIYIKREEFWRESCFIEAPSWRQTLFTFPEVAHAILVVIFTDNPCTAFLRIYISNSNFTWKMARNLNPATPWPLQRIRVDSQTKFNVDRWEGIKAAIMRDELPYPEFVSGSRQQLYSPAIGKFYTLIYTFSQCVVHSTIYTTFGIYLAKYYHRFAWLALVTKTLKVPLNQAPGWAVCDDKIHCRVTTINTYNFT